MVGGVHFCPRTAPGWTAAGSGLSRERQETRPDAAVGATTAARIHEARVACDVGGQFGIADRLRQRGWADVGAGGGPPLGIRHPHRSGRGARAVIASIVDRECFARLGERRYRFGADVAFDPISRCVQSYARISDTTGYASGRADADFYS